MDLDARLLKAFDEITRSDTHDSNLKRENANVDVDSSMGMMYKYGAEGVKWYVENKMLKKEHAEAHSCGDIHIHDLDFLPLTTTCCQIDIDKLFDGGFRVGYGYIDEPKTIADYANLTCLAIQSNQNDQHGGQSILNFDYSLAKGVAKSYVTIYETNLAKALDAIARINNPYVVATALLKELKESVGIDPVIADNNGFSEQILPLLTNLTNETKAGEIVAFAHKFATMEIKRETYRAMETLLTGLNTLQSRIGSQIPFSSINYGLDTSEEGRLVMKCILRATEAGLGKGETPIFPIQIFKLKEGINYNPIDPNYDLFQLACEVSAQRMYPNFSFVDAPFNKMFYDPNRPETSVGYMGCRTRVMANAYDPGTIGAKGRGNLSFTTINLPRIAIEAKSDLDRFYQELHRLMDLCIDQLMERYKIQASRKVRNYPFLMGQGVWVGSEKLSLDDTVGEVLKHGTLTVGFIGLAECLTALTGKHHGESDQAQQLGLEIVGRMRRRMDEEAEKTRFNYSLIATPAESLSGRFVKIDREKYGEIPGVTDKVYYTNSFHIPVSFHLPAYRKIDLEAPYHELTNAGHISYVELDGSPYNNVQAFERIVRYMKEKGMGYGSINHPLDRDPECGYSGVIKDDICPACGRNENDGVKFERIRRITGYLVGTLDKFNDAKRAEERERVKHFQL